MVVMVKGNMREMRPGEDFKDQGYAKNYHNNLIFFTLDSNIRPANSQGVLLNTLVFDLLGEHDYPQFCDC